MVLDLDRFKLVNDFFGHKVGDELLTGVGGLLGQRLRRTDSAARWGGDEFTILLPNADDEEAAIVADALLEAIRQAAMVFVDGEPISVTASIGISPFGQAYGFDASQVVTRADLAMYQAKRDGRDRWRLHRPEQAPRTGAGTSAEPIVYG